MILFAFQSKCPLRVAFSIRMITDLQFFFFFSLDREKRLQNEGFSVKKMFAYIQLIHVCLCIV